MAADFAELRAVQHRLTDALVELELDLRSPATRLTPSSGKIVPGCTSDLREKT